MADALEITVPLLILISLGFCSLIREYDLSNISNTAWVAEVPFTKIELPSVGPFILVHGLNYFLIFFTFSITLEPFELSQIQPFFLGEMKLNIMLATICVLYLFAFPLLEVTEYQEIPSGERILPLSLENHFMYSSLMVATMLVVESLYQIYGRPIDQDFISNFHIISAQLLLAIMVFIFAGLAILGFVNHLAEEIEN